MADGLVLLLSAIMVGILVYTKPNFFWNHYKMREARQYLSEADANRVMYGFLLIIGLVGLVMMVV
jgi:hypothetical protein